MIKRLAAVLAVAAAVFAAAPGPAAASVQSTLSVPTYQGWFDTTVYVGETWASYNTTTRVATLCVKQNPDERYWTTYGRLDLRYSDGSVDLKALEVRIPMNWFHNADAATLKYGPLLCVTKQVGYRLVTGMRVSASLSAGTTWTPVYPY